jgi:integrase
MTPPLSFSDFQDRILSLYAEPLRARSTYYGMRLTLGEFARLPGVLTVADLTTVRVAAYVESRAGCNVNTTISHLRCLKTASLFAVAEGWLERPPQWKRLMPRHAPPCRRRHYDYGQVVAVLDHLRSGVVDWKTHRLFALAATVAYTGLRRNEALYLHKCDVDLNGGVLYVVARRRLKTLSSEAPVPVPSELAEVLARWLPESGPVWLFPGVTGKGPWSGGAPGYRPGDFLKAAGLAAGVPGVTWHGLRHTLAKLMVGRFGLTADQAKSYLRHADVRTTEGHYLHRDDAELLRAMGRTVSFRPPPAPG